MKKLYYMRLLAYDMLVSVDEEGNCRYLIETNDFPYMAELESEERREKALEFLESVEDDSAWNDDLSYNQLFDNFKRWNKDTDNEIEIIAEIEKEL